MKKKVEVTFSTLPRDNYDSSIRFRQTFCIWIVVDVTLGKVYNKDLEPDHNVITGQPKQCNDNEEKIEDCK